MPSAIFMVLLLIKIIYKKKPTIPIEMHIKKSSIKVVVIFGYKKLFL